MSHVFSRLSPSPRYLELVAQYQHLHRHGDPERGVLPEHQYVGRSLPRQVKPIKTLIDRFASKTILDYGAGRGKQYTAPIGAPPTDGSPPLTIPDYWGVDSVTCYDAGYEPFGTLPTGTFDGVVCTDVLEHVPQQDLAWVLDEIFSYARKFVFINLASYPAKAILPNGENAHCTVEPLAWWHQTIKAAAADHRHIHCDLSVETTRSRTRV